MEHSNFWEAYLASDVEAHRIGIVLAKAMDSLVEQGLAEDSTVLWKSMCSQAWAFWVEKQQHTKETNKMNTHSLTKLIDQTQSYMMEAKGDHALVRAYWDDMKAFQDIRYLINAGYTKAALAAIDELDKEPRQQVCAALNG